LTDKENEQRKKKEKTEMHCIVVPKFVKPHMWWALNWIMKGSSFHQSGMI